MSQACLKVEAKRAPPQEPRHKRFWRDKVITFSEVDAVPMMMPNSNALVINVVVAKRKVR